MSAALQQVLLTSPAGFLKLLDDLIRDLKALHRRMSPTLRQRILDYSECELDHITGFLEDTEVQLKMVALLRGASGLMVPLFLGTEMDKLDASLDVVAEYEEKLNKVVKWLYSVLDKCAGPE